MPLNRFAFLFALAGAMAWMYLSIRLAAPWVEELHAGVPRAVAWSMVSAIALGPGFISMFQVLTLLMRRRDAPPPTDGAAPPVSILVAAYNEAATIANTLASILAQHYPGTLQIIVIDDGSSDTTAAECARFAAQGVELLSMARNQGKAAALNSGLRQVRHELCVTVDADSWLHPLAIDQLVRAYLQDPDGLAAVAGAVFVGNASRSWVTRLQYWDYFHGIAAAKRVQAAHGGTLVAQGAFSLYRTAVLRQIGGWPPCVGEDIVATWSMLSRGYRVGYAELALCLTQTPVTLGQLFRQRIRWARGIIEAMLHYPSVFWQPRRFVFLAVCSLSFLVIDVAYSTIFIPGMVLACFGCFWIVGPATLALLPATFLLGAMMHRHSVRVFNDLGIAVRADRPAMLMYTLGNGLINHPAGMFGYAKELARAPKTWGTK